MVRSVGKLSEAVKDETARLYNDHALVLFRYGLLLAGAREAAQDALHEAFLRYFHARLAGQQIDSPKPWLFRVLRNYVLDQHRSQQSRREIGLESLAQAADAAPDPESLCWQGELSRSLAAALTPRELECFRLRSEGLRYGEIAEILGIRSGTVAALLARAHQKLRTIAGGRGPSSQVTRANLDCVREEPYAP